MADDLIGKDVVERTSRTLKDMMSKFSSEALKKFENDANYRTNIYIQAYKKVLEEIHNELRNLSLKRTREEAEAEVALSKARMKTASELIEWLNTEEGKLKTRTDLSKESIERELNAINALGLEQSNILKEELSGIEKKEKKAEVYRKNEEKHLTLRERNQRKIESLEDKLAEKRFKSAEAEANLAVADKDNEEEARKAFEKAKEEERKARNALAGEELKESLQKSLTALADKLTNVVDGYLETLGGYQAGMMARLQGSQADYDDMVSLVRRNLAGNPLIKQKDVLDNLQKLTDKGIAYDLEQRAFLATVSQKIATTFDALDGTLTRLIRLQQADTTAARLGMEANLTRMLNTMFSDTSYLSDVYDTVSGAILDANSQLSRENSVAFEYTVQKWLGALYSLGASSDFLSSVAKGINLLGTGDVSAMAGNESLQTLLAMSASKAGLSYGDLFFGLEADETNQLLRGMLEYLQEIAEGADNQVVRAAYGNILGLSMSDIAAIRNLTSDEIENIYNQNLSYGSSLGELQYQLSQVFNRTPLGERLKNTYENAMFSVAGSIFEDPVSYATYMITSAIQDVTGGIPIPSPFVFGSGIDLSSFTIEGIIKTGIVGLNLLGQIPYIIGNIGGSNGTGLLSWGGMPDYNTRGNEFLSVQSGSQKSTSSSTYIGSSSSSDMKSSSISSAVEEGNENKSMFGNDEDEFVKISPTFEGKARTGWEVFFKVLDENPIPVKVVECEPVVNVSMGFGDSKLSTPYTMQDLIDTVASARGDDEQSIKVSMSTFQEIINALNLGSVGVGL